MTYLVFGFNNGVADELLGTIDELPEIDVDAERLRLRYREIQFPPNMLRGLAYDCAVVETGSDQTTWRPVVAYFQTGKRDSNGRLL